jgi:hypothetical protein
MLNYVWTKERQKVCNRRGVRKGCSLSSILFNLQSEYFTKEAPEGFGGFKIGGQVIGTVKYADDLVLMAKKETLLTEMIDRLMEIKSCYEMEMNVVKSRVRRICRHPSPTQIMRYQNQPENAEYFNYFGSMITNDARCTPEIKSRIAMANAAFNRKKNLFTRKLDLNLRKTLVKC